MKKYLGVFLAIILCLTVISGGAVAAADNSKINWSDPSVIKGLMQEMVKAANDGMTAEQFFAGYPAEAQNALTSSATHDLKCKTTVDSQSSLTDDYGYSNYMVTVTYSWYGTDVWGHSQSIEWWYDGVSVLDANRTADGWGIPYGFYEWIYDGETNQIEQWNWDYSVYFETTGNYRWVLWPATNSFDNVIGNTAYNDGGFY